MKTLLLLLVTALFSTISFAQSDKEGVEAACMGYLEGFYEGDVAKLEASLKPTLNKFGFWKNKESGEFEHAGYMTFDEAKAYAKNVLDKKNFAKDNAPKKVEVLDIGRNIASAKVTAFWGIDYLLLSKTDGRWMIEQVIWEGPLDK